MESNAAIKLCSACGVKPRVDQREKSTNTQCSDCKYEAQKKWTMNKAEQEQAQAFYRGVEAMRAHIADNFAKYGEFQKWTGPQFANIIRRVEGPKLRETPEAVAS